MGNFLLLIFLSFILTLSYCEQQTSDENTIVDELQTDCTKNVGHYEELGVDTSRALNVNLKVTLLKIDIGPKMNAEITALVNQEWEDVTLDPNNSTLNRAIEGKIWQPEITLIDGELKNTNLNEKTHYFRLLPNDKVILSSKWSINVQCGHNYKYYPFDTQECLVKFGTYRFTMDEVLLHWPKMPIQIETLLQLNQFELVNISTFNEVDIRPGGTFSVLVLNLTIRRRFERILLTKFLPCILLLFLSYLSFWIPFAELLILRFLLPIISVLGQIFLYSTISDISSSPKLTALDSFSFGCLILTFCTLGHAIVIQFIKYYASLPTAPELLEYPKVNTSVPMLVINKSVLASWLDNIMRLLFPTVCFCLLVMYCALFVSHK